MLLDLGMEFPQLKKIKICKIEFKDGKLSVDVSKGISSDQMISFSFPSVTSFNVFM